MKKIIIFMFAAMTFIACQKEDENGDLGGFWKLMEIAEEGATELIDTKHDNRFWGIQLNLLEIRINDKERHYCRFQHVGDSLFVQTIDDNTNLQAYGIYNNSNERYGVLHLSSKSMILRSKFAKLTFRKF